jgi:hypothetical protein
MRTYWTIQRMAIGAGTVLAASLLLNSPASAKNTAGWFCSAESAHRSNYTWADGTATTTVYYNNHCGHDFNVTLHFITLTGEIVNKCWRTPTGKSHKVWDYSDLNDISKGC